MQYDHEHTALQIVFMISCSLATCVAFWVLVVLLFALEPSQPMFR